MKSLLCYIGFIIAFLFITGNPIVMAAVFAVIFLLIIGYQVMEVIEGHKKTKRL